MKLVVIGLGQCGCRVADEFARLNNRARSQRGVEIIVGAFAVNTDVADLTGLNNISKNYQSRILLGGRKAGGHGVGKLNEVGAEIAKLDGDKVIHAMRNVKQLFEADAFMVAASSGGGTGSGSLPVITKLVKERYSDKPVYALVVLPFEHEEKTEERTIYNTATCLKSVNSVADAVFLVSNQRYISKDYSLKNNLANINAQIVQPFYDILCAGEEKKSKYIGAKVLDAGDIIASVSGWTVFGVGKSELPSFRLPFFSSTNFRKKSTETHRGIKAMDEAVSDLSLPCNARDASRAFYLVSAPQQEINMEIVQELGDYLRELAPNAIIRNGDYPRQRGLMEVSVVLSGLSDVPKVRNYYRDSTELIPLYGQRQKEAEEKLKALDEVGEKVPTLIA
ncbi:MAG: tubulin/FtsZ family protein [Dehalococcoidia bacterium]|nr:tubulin/FtsZ family protein [Dehalococcoidia bacterium]